MLYLRAQDSSKVGGVYRPVRPMRWTMRMGEDTDSKNTIKSTYTRGIDRMMIKKLRRRKRRLKGSV